MNIGLWYYLFTICGKLSIMSWTAFGCILGFWAIYAICRAAFDEFSDTDVKPIDDIVRVIKKTTWVVIVSAALGIVIPSEKSLVTIAGLNIGETAVETVASSSTAQKAMELIDLKLDKYIEDAKKN